MSDLDIFHGPNAGYVMELYERFQRDPSSVDAETRAWLESHGVAEWGSKGVGESRATSHSQTPLPPFSPTRQIDVRTVVAAARVGRLTRELGHLAARIDPLGGEPHGDPELELRTHGISEADLDALPPTVIGGPLTMGAPNALVAYRRLREAYSGTIGYEEDHVQISAERDWLRAAVETRNFFHGFEAPEKRDLLARLIEVDSFEQFLHTIYVGQKRFSIEGADMLVPMLDLIIRDAAAAGTREVVMGMAHRGRLNVLAHILGKPYQAILSEFKAAQPQEGTSVSGAGLSGYSGDVKYHLGGTLTYRDDQNRQAKEMPVTLAPNPSHLEFVNPVVTGRARAAQESLDAPGLPRRDMKASLCIQIHGDAAFPGQGIVAETLNLSQLPGYRVGGTIHIIVNNQIGFTTGPRDARSTLYASDLAKGFEIPVVHVNADDPEACLAAARMAYAYRERFAKDFLIDLVGYRRYGHNEGDPADVTQPRMYEVINRHPRVWQVWAEKLQHQEVVSRDEVDRMLGAARQSLQEANERARPEDAIKHAAGEAPMRRQSVSTAVAEERLVALNDALLALPEGFKINRALERTMRQRRAIREPGTIQWGHAEALAYASILEDGIPIRLTGQDVERGTFAHRHAVLHDPYTGRCHIPLQELPQARASFDVHNSPLSENAVLGFEYGYSMHASGALVLWEAQFGDFANSAQVIIDQFIVSGHAKWMQTPSMVLLLPHGYEGAGPEHSSARLERFLQLTADDNIRVVCPTSAAQMFHVLRRQAALLHSAPRPLVVMTPKSLLRHPLAASSLADLTHGEFQCVIDDAKARKLAERVSRIILCSGKVYVDLIGSKPYADAAERAAVVRVEQLYPFPYRELEQVLLGYPNLREVVWLQEEPHNQGAWSFVSEQIHNMLGHAMELQYVGRPASASPATGSAWVHSIEQHNIIAAAVAGLAVPPELQSNGRKRSATPNVRRDKSPAAR